MDLDKLIMDTYGDGSMMRDLIKLKPGEPEQAPNFYGRRPPLGWRDETDAEYKARHMAAVHERGCQSAARDADGNPL